MNSHVMDMWREAEGELPDEGYDVDVTVEIDALIGRSNAELHSILSEEVNTPAAKAAAILLGLEEKVLV